MKLKNGIEGNIMVASLAIDGVALAYILLYATTELIYFCVNGHFVFPLPMGRLMLKGL